LAPPTVGITISIDAGARIRPGIEYLYVQRSYSRALREAGACPVLLTPDADPGEVARRCGALVITGGDWLPDSFGEGAAPPPRDAECAERVDWDRALIDAAADSGVPLLGVCYGMQLLNLHFGGRLVAGDAASPQSRAGVDHGGSGRVVRHAVETMSGSRLAGWIGSGCEVASSHHQRVSEVAPGFRVAAVARDQVIEAIEWEGDGWLVGVEWHPEQDGSGAGIYGALVAAANTSGSAQ